MLRKRQLRLLILSLMMLLLSSGTTAYADIVLGQAGTCLNEPAYIVPIEDGRDTLKLIDTQDAEIKTLWQSINKKDEQIDRLVIISEELINKNAQLNNKIKKAKQIGIGVFAGVSHLGEPVVGIGFVWKLW